MNRRQMLQLSMTAAAAAVAPAIAEAEQRSTVSGKVEQWNMHEITLHGPTDGNPFLDVTLTATFSLDHRNVDVTGFYDGNGLYRIRFMPDTPGHWTWRTASSSTALANQTGSFDCTPATGNNHGPVNVAHQFHFQHADGTPYFPFGTTCYACAFMGSPWEEQTIATLRSTGFNKVRLCLMPKGQPHPLFALPFVQKPDGTNDLARLDPTYFQHVEKTIATLSSLNIQADLILFHPYDSWGFKSMPREADDLYLRYAIARLAAYRNIWWSVANEYDLVKTKTMPDWDHFFKVIQQCDPYSHLRSIHHSGVRYDNSKPWVTHASLQEYDFEKSAEFRAAWNKPIIYDEIQYEGNISRRWGNLSAEEMTRRFWLAIINGTYATHGETFISPPGTPVWSDGGKLIGTSAARIAFLRSVVEKITHTGLNQYEGAYYLSAGKPNEVYLYYFDTHSLGDYDFPLPEGVHFKCTLIDPWNMTTNELPGTFTGKPAHVKGAPRDKTEDSPSYIKLASKPYMAALFQKV
ncbi:MAG: DUF5060 domain-containing protein [Acidobacteriota bacterium]